MNFAHVRYSSLIVMLLFFTGCSKAPTSEPQTPTNAKGETPIRFIICSVGDVDCKVFARFDNLGSCEGYKDYSSALCDSVSTPGKIICDKLTMQSSTVVAYCTI